MDIDLYKYLLTEKIAAMEDALRQTPLYVELDRYKEELYKINAIQNGPPDISSDAPYPTDASWIDKAVTIIDMKGIPMTCGQIIDQILEYEPHHDRRKIKSSMSAVLGTYSEKKRKKIKRKLNASGEYEYTIKNDGTALHDAILSNGFSQAPIVV